MNADPRLTIGGNKPPLSIEVQERHKDLFVRMETLAAALDLVPPVITNDDDEGKAQDLVRSIKSVLGNAKAQHKLEKEPYDDAIKELKSLFAKPMEAIEKVAAEVLSRLDAYKEKKAAAERLRREEEARKQREEAERLAREAEEAERRRAEEEARRRAAEEAARKAEEEKRRAEEEARRQREEAERLRQEALRLEQERRAREAVRRAEEDERRRVAEQQAAADAEEAARRAAQAAAEEAERRAQREKEEAEHRAKLAELKRQQDEATARATAEREAAKAALDERRKAEEEAAAAKRGEKSAERLSTSNLDAAVRSERRADRLDGAAQAPESDLSRGRGDYGSVGSRVTRWTWRMVDRDKVPLEALRAYLHPDAMDAAITRFMQAHRPELGKGRDRDGLLPGVEFFEDVSTRVS